MQCKRCGSKAVSIWKHGNLCRIRCGYCDADTNEQKSEAEAERIWNSFKKVEGEEAQSACHVLTVEELLDYSEYDDNGVRCAWLENRGLFITPALVQCGVAEREHDIVRAMTFTSFGCDSYYLDKYNSWWRCWNRKPTEEQSEAIPWDKMMSEA